MKILLVLSILSFIPCNTYINPVIHEQRPDPGVLRIKENSYMLVSTGAFAKGVFPLMHSTDLVNWELHQYIFPIDKLPSWVCCDFWAPEIHHWGGDTYIIYFASKNVKNMQLSIGAARSFSGPFGPYSLEKEPILTFPTFGVIDAHFVRDPKDNTSYLLWKVDGNEIGKPTPIYMQKLDQKEGMSLDSNDKPIELIRNDLPWEDICVEGPWIEYKQEFGYYYLFYSGNVFNNPGYSIGVARSKNINGPYEKYGKQILHSDEDGKFYGPGHNSVTQDNSGKQWMLYHAWNKDEPSIGREMFIDPIEWSQDGWPYIRDGSPSKNEEDGPK